MNDEAPPNYSGCVVNLLLKQDELSQGWLKFLLTIQSALAVAFVYLFTLKFELPSASQLRPFLITIVPVLGMIISISLTGIVLRQRRWVEYYARKFADLSQTSIVDPGQSLSYKIFPREADQPPSFGGLPVGIGTAKVISMTGACITVGWLIVFIFVLAIRPL